MKDGREIRDAGQRGADSVSALAIRAVADNAGLLAQLLTADRIRGGDRCRNGSGDPRRGIRCDWRGFAAAGAGFAAPSRRDTARPAVAGGSFPSSANSQTLSPRAEPMSAPPAE